VAFSIGDWCGMPSLDLRSGSQALLGNPRSAKLRFAVDLERSFRSMRAQVKPGQERRHCWLLQLFRFFESWPAVIADRWIVRPQGNDEFDFPLGYVRASSILRLPEDLPCDGKSSSLFSGEVLRDKSAVRAAKVRDAVRAILAHVDLTVGVCDLIDYIHPRASSVYTERHIMATIVMRTLGINGTGNCLANHHDIQPTLISPRMDSLRSRTCMPRSCVGPQVLVALRGYPVQFSLLLLFLLLSFCPYTL
jgi:hypothetical protein